MKKKSPVRQKPKPDNSKTTYNHIIATKENKIIITQH